MKLSSAAFHNPVPSTFRFWMLVGLTLILLGLPLQASAETWTLDQFPESQIQSEGRIRFGSSADNKPIVMAGKTYPKGVGVFGSSEIPVYLDGQATRFTGIVGLSDRDAVSKPSMEFSVVGDDHVLWSSGPLECGSVKEVSVPINGVRKLSLKVTPIPNRRAANVNWAQSVIEYQGDIPSASPIRIVLQAKDLKLELGVQKDGILVLNGLSDKASGLRSRLKGILFPAAPWRQNSAKLPSPIEVIDSEGWNGLDLRYVSHAFDSSQPGIEHLTFKLEDKLQKLSAELHFKTFRDSNVIEQWLTLTNQGTKTVQVPKLQPGYLRLQNPGDVYLETCVTESATPSIEKLVPGIRVIESRDFQRHNDGYTLPWFILGIGAPIQEDKGDCLIGSLAWSGATRMSFEVSSGRLTIGVGTGSPGVPTLAAGETMTSPIFAFTYSVNGKGQASRSFHRYARQYGIAGGDRIRPVDNNSWEGCGFRVNEMAITEMMKQSQELGIELYVLDDGWFGVGQNARTGDRAGLGDWTVDPMKFTNGLVPLIEAGKKLPIAFGLWFEPEMVNPKSDLMTKHPDWVMRHPAQELSLQRNQAALDVPNPAVQDFMYHLVEDTLKANPGIRMIKWDCNSSLNNAYSPYLASQGISQGNLLLRYMEGYYSVLRKLHEAHPEIDFQACAAGGGRADLGAMRYSHTYWPSDNTDPLYRLKAVWNYQTILPPIATTCHVTHAGDYQPKFRFDVAMMGQLGMEVDTRKSSPEYLSAAKIGIDAYKKVREIVQFGDQYRTSVHPNETPTPTLNYVSADRKSALLLAFQTGNPAKIPLAVKAPVQGLDEALNYRAEEINLPAGDAQPRLAAGDRPVRTGKAWMQEGVPLSFTRKMDSAAIRFVAE
jgi:alpha-galactosidase